MQPGAGGLETAQLAVLLGVALPLVGHGALMEDRVHRALRLAGATLDAFVRVDVVHVRGFVNTRDRADVHAAGVLLADARLDNDVRHTQ